MFWTLFFEKVCDFSSEHSQTQKTVKDIRQPLHMDLRQILAHHFVTEENLEDYVPCLLPAQESTLSITLRHIFLFHPIITWISITHNVCQNFIISDSFLHYHITVHVDIVRCTLVGTSNFSHNPYPTAFPYGNGMVLHLPATRQQHDQNCTQSH